MTDLRGQRIETTFQDRLNPKSWAKISILRMRPVCVSKIPMEIGRVEIFAPLPLEVRDFANAQLALDHTVEDPAEESGT